MFSKLVSLALIVTPLTLNAQELEHSGQLTNESEAAIVLVTGNSENETYRLKNEMGYRQFNDIYKLGGNYLLGRTSGIDTARAWELAARYEHAYSEYFNGYLGYGAESNIFSGLIQRDSADIGGKYYSVKTESTKLFTELGYRFARENEIRSQQNSHYARVYSEGSTKYTDYVSAKLWIEYLHNFSSNQDYQINFEPSLSVALGEIFALKLSYLGKYDNEPGRIGAKRLDTIYTTALTAKF